MKTSNPSGHTPAGQVPIADTPTGITPALREWAADWNQARPSCYRCRERAMEIASLGVELLDSVMYENWSCPCGARWTVEWKEVAICVARDGQDGDWIELAELEEKML